MLKILVTSRFIIRKKFSDALEMLNIYSHNVATEEHRLSLWLFSVEMGGYFGWKLWYFRLSLHTCCYETEDFKRDAFVLPAHTLNQVYYRQLSERQTKQTAENFQNDGSTRTVWFNQRQRTALCQRSNYRRLKSCAWPFTTINSLICPLWICVVSENEITLLSAVYMTSFPTSDNKLSVTAGLPAEQ